MASRLSAQPSSSQHGYLRILAIWSKAGVGTSVVLETTDPSANSYAASSSTSTDASADNPRESNHKQTKGGSRIVFDIGATPIFDESIPANIVIVSHGHVDHFGAIFNHARAHALTYFGSTPTYYVPYELVSKLERAREVMSEIDAANDGTGTRHESLIRMNIVGVKPGDEFDLKQRKVYGGIKLFLRAFRVDHGGHPALGYLLGARKPPKLKEEYKGLSGLEIRDLVKSGVQVKSEPEEILEVTYTGDTSALGIMNKTDEEACLDVTLGSDLDTSAMDEATEERIQRAKQSAMLVRQAFQAQLIICELTYLDFAADNKEQQNLARSRGHMHLDDLIPVLSSHNWNIELEKVTTKDSNEYHDSKIVFFHLSARYETTQALDSIAAKIPNSILGQCEVAISSLVRKQEEGGDWWIKLIRENGCIPLEDYVTGKREHDQHGS